MDNEPDVWQNCGQVSLDDSYLLTVVTLNGRRAIVVSDKRLEMFIDMSQAQADNLSAFLIGPPLDNDEDGEW